VAGEDRRGQRGAWNQALRASLGPPPSCHGICPETVTKFKNIYSWTLVAHAYNPSYSKAEIKRIAVRSQPRQIVHETLSQKYPPQKRADGVAQGVGPEHKKKKPKKQKNNYREVSSL
jgi:hypothetical protein